MCTIKYLKQPCHNHAAQFPNRFWSKTFECFFLNTRTRSHCGLFSSSIIILPPFFPQDISSFKWNVQQRFAHLNVSANKITRSSQAAYNLLLLIAIKFWYKKFGCSIWKQPRVYQVYSFYEINNKGWGTVGIARGSNCTYYPVAPGSNPNGVRIWFFCFICQWIIERTN